MNLTEDKLYSKLVALDAIYNFVVELFFIWNYLEFENIILNSWILKFKIFKKKSNLTWSIPKFVVLDTIYNFVVEKCFTWSCLEPQICVLSS